MVSVDARLPNRLFADAVAEGELKEFDYPEIDIEVGLGKSRIDLRLSRDREICWVETKSVTLVEEGVAKFPDAPTERGRRHLLELVEAIKNGVRAAVVFVIQRQDAQRFMPNTAIDPEFSTVLARVVAAGVEVKAYRCDVSLDSIQILDEIPVILR